MMLLAIHQNNESLDTLFPPPVFTNNMICLGDNYSDTGGGFAHGFITLSDTAEFLYKTTNYYAPSSDRGIKWNDETIAIEWPELDCDITTSAKDSVAKSLFEADHFI
ncbi:dTDP-4-dehydrorhamnose 3,5-epimerase [Aeromonas sanarellii]|nr:dTDP-4-dehydrorhamnose 3,5-epimerase [Aeromonas sanarellii]